MGKEAFWKSACCNFYLLAWLIFRSPRIAMQTILHGYPGTPVIKFRCLKKSPADANHHSSGIDRSGHVNVTSACIGLSKNVDSVM